MGFHIKNVPQHMARAIPPLLVNGYEEEILMHYYRCEPCTNLAHHLLFEELRFGERVGVWKVRLDGVRS